MKQNTLLLLGAGIAAYFLITKSKSDAVAAQTGQASAPKDTVTVAGALGATMTGNPMLQAMGSLGNGRVTRNF